MNLGKQKRGFIIVLLMTLLLSFGIIKPSNAYDLGVGGLSGAPPSTSFLEALASGPPVGGIPVSITSEPTNFLKKAIGGPLSKAVWAAVAYAVDAATYQTAVWLASGGGGQKPLWLTEAGFDKLVDGAVGESIYALGDNVGFLKKYGVSLCVPPDLKLQLWLQLDLAEQWQPAAPHCSFKQIKEAWGRIDEPNYWKGVGVGFRPGQNDLSMLLAADQAIKTTSLRKKEESKEELTYKGQAVSPTNVAGQAKVPISWVEKLQQDLTDDSQKVKISQAQSTADAFNAGDWTGALLNVGRIFTNTFSTKLLEKAQNKGFISLIDLFLPGDEKAAVSLEAQIVGGRQAAEIAFAEFLKPNLPAVEQWSYTGELAADCAANPSPYCGVMDNSLQTALAQAESGGAVTVKQALEKGFLHGDWFLLPPNSDCPREAYCYENLVKLRQLRILPIGWELAAKASLAGKPTSLQKAVDAFSAPAANNLFYHLIDPYWILKAPVAKCGAMAFSANFLMPPAADGTGGQRGEYCADVQNCVQEDEAGQCNQGSWGYCLKEKNRWILGGDFCDAQFNTCTTYANNKGQTASYLANTIEKSICNADNVGCRAYVVSSILDKDDKWQWDTAQSAAKIYFNAKAAQCDYSNEGCSQFVRTGFGLIGGAEVGNEKVNLKKAPAYYNCYGETLAVANNYQFSSSTVPWAVNKADMAKIFDSWKQPNKEKCGNFAQVCSYDEVGCEKYTPANGDLPIPGILTANDQCPSACIGYESFKQQDTNFEKAPTELAYFIPSTAVSCQEPEAGCDEFVNLEAQTAGGEGKEYYTELRQCSQTESDGAVYYTWEGSDTAGYQLRSFNLKKGATLMTGESGIPPAYNTADALKLTEYQTNCNSDAYKNKTADADCREFYDKDGNKSYRLYTKTITVSATDCKKLRKTVSDKISCDATSGIWEPTQKICTYLAIPKEGRLCKAAVVGCRAYKGNAGNNFYALPNFPITFENGAVGGDAQQLTGWPGKFSAESTVVGGKSLKVSNGHTEITTSLAKGTTYSFSFWAKGLGEGLAVSVKPTDANGVAKSGVGADIIFNVPLHADWQNYTVGPIVIDWDESTASSTVRFDSVSGKVFYLDNIVAKQMSGNIYVVKNSWKTPSVCDNLTDDEYGQSQGGSYTNPYRLVPQAMLGCQKYTDRQNQEVAVKSFTSMCREEAVGCEEFVDTHNSASSEAKIVNAICEYSVLPNGQQQKNETNSSIDCQDADKKTLCSILPDQSQCRFEIAQNKLPQPKLGFNITSDSGTITIPADNKVYLVNDKNNYCSADQLGCAALGSVSYSTTGTAQVLSIAYLKNQSEIYGQILCEQKSEGCEEFKTTQGAAYFKDPAVENNFCEYQVEQGAFTVAGWYKKGVGFCGNKFGEICVNDQDCAAPVKCVFNAPCDYPDKKYTILKNGDAGYNGAVGLCPAEQNGCAEFIDPMDTTPIHASGTPYFVINNSKLDRAACGNQVSLQEGCVLFNETSKGVVTWAAGRTYLKSEDNKNEKVNPVDCGSKGEKTTAENSYCLDNDDDANSANTILKVRRDRVCGEWLACKSSMSVRDDAAVGGWKEMCTELAPCLEANSEASTLTGKCAKWASGETQVTKDTYKVRDVTWGGDEYSGYTLPNAYQIQTLSVKDEKLEYDTSKGVFTDSPAPTTALPESCRGFAQSDTPAGMCSYTKVAYSAQNTEPITKYWPYNQLLGADGVCSGGFDELGNQKIGLSCVHSGNCTDDRPLNPAEMAFAIKEHGVCMLSKQVSKSRGWEGYCLDPAALSAVNDTANSSAGGAKAPNQPKNCTLWYPLTTPSGSVSSDHLNASAGYVPPSGAGKYWCVMAKGNANIANTTSTFSYAYAAYKDARQFYPHTADGYNGNACKSGDQVQKDCYDKVGQSSCTCPGEKNTYTITTQNFDAFGQPIKNPAGKNTFTDTKYDSDYSKTQKVGSELVTTYDREPLYISEVAAIGLIATGDFYGDDGYYDDNWPVNPLYIFRDQRLAGIENIKDDDMDGRYWSGPLKKFGNYWVMDLTWTVGNKSGAQAEEINYEAITEAVCKQKLAVGSESASMGFRAYFDASGRLNKIGTKICDAGSHASGMQMNLVFYLSEVCTDIRQVVDTDSDGAIKSPMGFLAKGRTDRLWPVSKYLVGADLQEKNEIHLDLQYNQLFAPFGSFSQSGNPVTSTLTEYTKQFKTSYAQRNALNQAGFWPIWTMPGGATPLSCAKDNKGDCGQVALCESGPQKGLICDPDEDNNGNGIPGDDSGYPKACEWHPLATCDFSGTKSCVDASKAGMNGNPCTAPADCQSHPGNSAGDCLEYRICSDGPKKGLKCGPPDKVEDGDDEDGSDWCNSGYNSILPTDCTVGTGNVCKIKSEYVSGDSGEEKDYIAYKCTFANTRGLCVGGLNHGQFCGGSLDCPPKKHSDSTEDTVEYGVCVGAALDEGKVIPKNDTIGTGFGRGLERLLELFPAWFNTWEWKDNHYTEYLPDSNQNKWQGQTGFHTFNGKYDYTKAQNILFSGSCGTYPTGSCNPKANVYPKPPTVTNIKVNDQSGDVSGFGGSLNAVLRFNAYADNDQMPIVRMSVDWGDGSDPYVMQGWFKNRKKYCGVKVGGDYKVCKGDGTTAYGVEYDYNKSCKVNNDCGTGFACKDDPENRLRFGDSPSACEEGFYQFTHIYECKGSSDPKWNTGKAACVFTPKVQVLDNWGWCNSSDGNGRWNDNETDPKNDDKRNCYWGKTEPWTSFGGTVEVTP